MADVASLVFDIDASGAVGAAKILAKLDRASADLATNHAKLAKVSLNAKDGSEALSRAVERERYEITALAARYNPVLSSQIRFAKAQGEVADAVRLGVIQQSQQAAILAKLSTEYSRSATLAGRMFNVIGGGVGQVQNAGYQVGDFFVQIASGQSVMMALSQQIPQLLGGFGAIGAILGATTAIAGAAWMIWGAGVDESNALEEAIDGLSSSVNNYRTALKGASGEGLAETFGVMSREAQRTYELMMRMEKINFMRSTQETIAQTNAGFDKILNDLSIWDTMTKNIASTSAGNVGNLINLERTRAAEIRAIASQSQKILDTYGLTVNQAASIRNEMEALNKATTEVDKARAMGDLGEAMLKAAEAGAKIPPEMQKVAQEAINASQRILDMIGAMQSASSIAADAMTDTRGESIRENRASVQEAREYRINKIIEARVKAYNAIGRKSSGGGGSGGSAAIQQAEKQFQSIRELLEKETVFQFAEYEKRNAQLTNALNKERITKEQYAKIDQQLRAMYFGTEYAQRQVEYDMSLEQLRQALELEYITRQEYEAKRAQLQWQNTNAALDLNSTLFGAQLNGLSGYFQQASQLAGGGYSGLLKAQQAFGAASALVSAYSGAAQALADPTLTTWQKIAAAGKVLTTGLGFVAAIRSGGKAGGSGAVSSSVSAAQAAEPQKTTMVRIEGDAMFGQLMEGIVKSLWSRSKDGELIIYQGGR